MKRKSYYKSAQRLISWWAWGMYWQFHWQDTTADVLVNRELWLA